MRYLVHRLLSSRNLIAQSKGQKASPCGVSCQLSCQLSKYAHKTLNDWSIILLNLHNNKTYRFSKGEWVEALDQAAMVTAGLGNSGVVVHGLLWPVWMPIPKICLKTSARFRDFEPCTMPRRNENLAIGVDVHPTVTKRRRKGICKG